MAPAEYVIVRKLEYFRESSEKHLRDIRSMLEHSSEQIDRGELQTWIRARGLAEAWRVVSGD